MDQIKRIDRELELIVRKLYDKIHVLFFCLVHGGQDKSRQYISGKILRIFGEKAASALGKRRRFILSEQRFPKLSGLADVFREQFLFFAKFPH